MSPQQETQRFVDWVCRRMDYYIAKEEFLHEFHMLADEILLDGESMRKRETLKMEREQIEAEAELEDAAISLLEKKKKRRFLEEEEEAATEARTLKKAKTKA
ncbi:hypothetical protein HKX48_006614 [Thoreauomyces humboldtii]|nr:hypothetical protein HKX48_006614 [Thoreauomyces humboldtii]